ncbi:NAD(P)/FAD-dependent oxidoreductase [Arthrobacter gengyunqii]|uniref:NAD(P)/FAD-dependent oxidoreductase n=1 Tax=Arthrobacter gengyunqii TaxID=2886940 RepID=A0A9X1S966_9MICC|nr:NAD(P)/FAD-dependent oxidoreductase [Arthrobacter gengyunqii]MCC3270614.1 NAD(P)/FAD-dependent oxidoreductase [Arthrobacter gengyunqii]UOY97344.1 NAD(P)/FAD-dependent oxidoreductase [Arthrobacter gengyunqii]
MTVSSQQTTDYDALIVGAGFAGMYMLKRLRDDLGLRVRVVERGEGVGGTWYWNRYPGARCDVESLFYSYSFSSELQQEWEWTERYPTQPEILRYANHVADRFNLRPDIAFSTSVNSARYDERQDRWIVETDDGAISTAQYLITAVGCLSASRVPDFEGIDTFQGSTYHTGEWPHEGVDFTGRRVAVIGTGSSAIQSIPEIAAQAAQLTVFQRTPNFSVPAVNRRLDPAEIEQTKADYDQLRQEARLSPSGVLFAPPIGRVGDLSTEVRTGEMKQRWENGGAGFMSAFLDTGVDIEANEVVAEYVRDRIREIVERPEVAELLIPRDHPIGTKRICVDTDYYATYNRDNVKLVSVRETPIERITEQGVVVAGKTYEVDDIVFATGFDAMTGALTAIDIHGVDGIMLRDKWAAGPRTYLGIATAGFPNLFMITAPGSPSVLSNMIVSIEQHVDWITGHIAYALQNGVTRTDVDPTAEDAWVDHVNTAAHQTLYPTAASWYMGANIPGKPRIFMPYIGGVGAYRNLCDQIAEDGYRGFLLEAGAAPKTVGPSADRNTVTAES